MSEKVFLKLILHFENVF